MAVTRSDRSDGLTARIRDLIYIDRAKYYEPKPSNDGVPSPIGETKTFVKMFQAREVSSDENSINLDKVKKIEFS